MRLAVGLSHRAFNKLNEKYIPSLPNLLGVCFIRIILSNAFCAFVEMENLIFILHFVKGIYHVYIFVNTEIPFIPGKNPI